jgi:hypothetical protein
MEMILIYCAAALCIAFFIVKNYCAPAYLLWYAKIRLNRRRLMKSRPATMDGHDVVVGLTTIPSRLQYIFPTINSILLQSRPPNRIYLNLPNWSKREDQAYHIPEIIKKDHRIVLCRCGEDQGPILKLLPVLEKETNPETIIITVDDDTVYPRHAIRILLEYHDILPEAALGFRGWRIPQSNIFFDRKVLFANQVDRPYRVDILSGVSGVLYLRKHFSVDFFCRTGLPPESFFVDDICISGYLKKAGVEKFILPFPMREPFSRYAITSRSNPLWKINRDGHNDQVMLNYFFQQ